MEKGKISAFQMGIMMYHAIIATAILSVPGITARYAKTDLWISPIWASTIGFLTLWIVMSLFKLFPKKTYSQICEQALGKIPGKLLGFLYFYFFVYVTGQITRSYAEFLIGVFFPKTPISVIIISMLFLSAITIKGGLEVVARCAQIIFPIFFFSIFIIMILLSPQIHLLNVLPIMENGILPSLKGAIVPQVWFGEIFIIIFLLPYLSDVKKHKKWGIITVLFVLFTFIMINLTVLFILGPNTGGVYPFLETARFVNIANFIDNLDALIMAIWILGLFVKITVFYYVTVVSAAQWLNISDYKPIIWPIGILIIEMGFWSLPNLMVLSQLDTAVNPFWGMIMFTLIPLLIVGIASIRSNRKSKSNSLLS
ncbi:endospore germination permease [Cytobacillus spongiae]|uniref:GerAB/ArcD/ProY family transporter n=1 Tax=Cytobacillus spongiae TaxID=2901381 RepID=UPI001F25FC46|nr:endospore germination permease [Cytobacillus spongiae]UII57705.1 endospore germination permease [Cytobacillus spongiae]